MSKRKFILFFSFLITIFIISIVSFSFVTYKATVVIEGKRFLVEVAETDYLLEKGLSGRESLAMNSGMLFVFQKSDKYGFWMEDMKFSIDIIWIGDDLKISHIEKDVHPSTFPNVFYPPTPARYVLELPAGHSDALNIKIGDNVQVTKKWL